MNASSALWAPIAVVAVCLTSINAAPTARSDRVSICNAIRTVDSHTYDAARATKRMWIAFVPFGFQTFIAVRKNEIYQMLRTTMASGHSDQTSDFGKSYLIVDRPMIDEIGHILGSARKSKPAAGDWRLFALDPKTEQGIFVSIGGLTYSSKFAIPLPETLDEHAGSYGQIDKKDVDRLKTILANVENSHNKPGKPVD